MQPDLNAPLHQLQRLIGNGEIGSESWRTVKLLHSETTQCYNVFYLGDDKIYWHMEPCRGECTHCALGIADPMRDVFAEAKR